MDDLFVSMDPKPRPGILGVGFTQPLVKATNFLISVS